MSRDKVGKRGWGDGRYETGPVLKILNGWGRKFILRLDEEV
jgi:hypothetical protein